MDNPFHLRGLRHPGFFEAGGRLLRNEGADPTPRRRVGSGPVRRADRQVLLADHLNWTGRWCCQRHPEPDGDLMVEPTAASVPRWPRCDRWHPPRLSLRRPTSDADRRGSGLAHPSGDLDRAVGCAAAYHVEVAIDVLAVAGGGDAEL